VLAGRGHQVRHTYAGQYTTGRGRLTTEATDPAGLSIAPITVDVPFEKYSPLGRWRFEAAYGKALVADLERDPPDVLVTANVPLFVERSLTTYARRARLPWVLWHQDIVSLAVTDEAARRLPAPLVPLVRRVVEGIERAALRQAAAVVPIGDSFVAQYHRWGLDLRDVSVVPNWAPLTEIYPCPRDNGWAQEQGLRPDGLRLVYAGTLGRKHNPELLVELLEQARAAGVDADLVVVSEGEGADLVAQRGRQVPGVRVLPFQPVARLPEVLSSGDVLVALLEPDASAFSIPSKVLSYFAAGRTVLGLLPEDNASAADISAAGGHVEAPTASGVTEAAAWLATVAGDRQEIELRGRRARDLAERRFDVNKSADEFVALMSRAVGRRPAESAAAPRPQRSR
jgi:colanic acid biosynthesis glycosyl transferase WcaI